MNLKSQQAKKLLRLKQLRADAAKARAAKAAMLLNIARVQEQQSRIHLSETRLNADERRKERLQAIFDSPSGHGSLQSLAVSAWLKTDEEIATATQNVSRALETRMAGERGLSLAQQELARTMRATQKAEELLSLETRLEREAGDRQN